jgi:hypothetical protein
MTRLKTPESGIDDEPMVKKNPALGAGLSYLAERTGLEPATPGVTGRYSDQLNYRSKMVGAVGIEPTTLAL